MLRSTNTTTSSTSYSSSSHRLQQLIGSPTRHCCPRNEALPIVATRTALWDPASSAASDQFYFWCGSNCLGVACGPWQAKDSFSPAPLPGVVERKTAPDGEGLVESPTQRRRLEEERPASATGFPQNPLDAFYLASWPHDTANATEKEGAEMLSIIYAPDLSSLALVEMRRRGCALESENKFVSFQRHQRTLPAGRDGQLPTIALLGPPPPSSPLGCTAALPLPLAAAVLSDGTLVIAYVNHASTAGSSALHITSPIQLHSDSHPVELHWSSHRLLWVRYQDYQLHAYACQWADEEEGTMGLVEVTRMGTVSLLPQARSSAWTILLKPSTATSIAYVAQQYGSSTVVWSGEVHAEEAASPTLKHTSCKAGHTLQDYLMDISPSTARKGTSGEISLMALTRSRSEGFISLTFVLAPTPSSSLLVSEKPGETEAFLMHERETCEQLLREDLQDGALRRCYSVEAISALLRGPVVRLFRCSSRLLQACRPGDRAAWRGGAKESASVMTRTSIPYPIQLRQQAEAVHQSTKLVHLMLELSQALQQQLTSSPALSSQTNTMEKELTECVERWWSTPIAAWGAKEVAAGQRVSEVLLDHLQERVRRSAAAVCAPVNHSCWAHQCSLEGVTMEHLLFGYSGLCLLSAPASALLSSNGPRGVTFEVPCELLLLIFMGVLNSTFIRFSRGSEEYEVALGITVRCWEEAASLPFMKRLKDGHGSISAVSSAAFLCFAADAGLSPSDILKAIHTITNKAAAPPLWLRISPFSELSLSFDVRDHVMARLLKHHWLGTESGNLLREQTMRLQVPCDERSPEVPLLRFFMDCLAPCLQRIPAPPQQSTGSRSLAVYQQIKELGCLSFPPSSAFSLSTHARSVGLEWLVKQSLDCPSSTFSCPHVTGFIRRESCGSRCGCSHSSSSRDGWCCREHVRGACAGRGDLAAFTAAIASTPSTSMGQTLSLFQALLSSRAYGAALEAGRVLLEKHAGRTSDPATSSAPLQHRLVAVVDALQSLVPEDEAASSAGNAHCAIAACSVGQSHLPPPPSSSVGEIAQLQSPLECFHWSALSYLSLPRCGDMTTPPLPSMLTTGAATRRMLPSLGRDSLLVREEGELHPSTVLDGVC